jgi:hypothetical protein
MTRKPNGFQKLLHRILMLRPVTAFAASRVHRIDQAILKLTGGKFTISEILGWNIIQLTTTGAKTNQLCTVQYKQRAAHRHIPVMVLEPKT